LTELDWELVPDGPDQTYPAKLTAAYGSRVVSVTVYNRAEEKKARRQIRQSLETMYRIEISPVGE
jgi:hypothetical protein